MHFSVCGSSVARVSEKLAVSSVSVSNSKRFIATSCSVLPLHDRQLTVDTLMHTATSSDYTFESPDNWPQANQEVLLYTGHRGNLNQRYKIFRKLRSERWKTKIVPCTALS